MPGDETMDTNSAAATDTARAKTADGAGASNAVEARGAGILPAQIMAEIARRAMDQGQEAMRAAFSSINTAQAPIAEWSYRDGCRALDNTARLAEACQTALERTAGDIQDLAASAAQCGLGAQRTQRAWIDASQSSANRIGAKMQTLWRCGSPVEMAEVQRDIYVDAISSIMEMNAALLTAMSQTVQDALRPLERRAPTAR